MAYNVGDAPSLFCAFDRHAECADRDYRNCTCRCHHFNDDGLRPVCDVHLEDDGCAPDCPYCNGTDDAPCLCGPTCDGSRVEDERSAAYEAKPQHDALNNCAGENLVDEESTRND